jgi:hypothetical protein
VSDHDPFAKGGGPPSATLKDVGDFVEGTIVKVEHKNDTDLATGEVKTFPDGNPKPVIVVHLDTRDGPMRDFVKGRAVSEFRQKVWAVEGEGNGPQAGANYKRAITRIDPPKKKGYSGEKVSEITYRSGGAERELA